MNDVLNLHNCLLQLMRSYTRWILNFWFMKSSFCARRKSIDLFSNTCSSSWVKGLLLSVARAMTILWQVLKKTHPCFFLELNEMPWKMVVVMFKNLCPYSTQINGRKNLFIVCEVKNLNRHLNCDDKGIKINQNLHWNQEHQGRKW